jgi:phage head maturation protease
MMDLTDPSVASVYGKIKMMADNGLKMGVSIGYQTVKSEPAENGVRRLKELALHEISITPFPMNTEATITAAKTRKAKYAAKADVWSKIVTRRKAVTQTQDATPALVAELKTILKLIKETA